MIRQIIGERSEIDSIPDLVQRIKARETYTLVGSRRTDKILRSEVIGEGWSAKDVSDYFEALGEYDGEDE